MIAKVEQIPKGEGFILDVRRAVRLGQKPTVTTDSDLISAEAVSKALYRAAIWRTPKTVETYDPAEFSRWPQELQENLRGAVESFRAVAADVAPDEPASNGQFKQGVAAFNVLQDALRQVVLWDWQQAAEELLQQAEAWSNELGWRTRRVQKKMTEMLLGEYSLHQLQLWAGELYVLDPVARFVPGALGAFDFSIQPSFYLTSVYRSFGGDWYVNLDLARGIKGAHPERWSKESLQKAIEELRSQL